MAVGSNDNRATIWDISRLYSPIRKFVLLHDSAVKGILYCPWSPTLLATGGGSHDRRIRFWHTTTGSLIRKYDTLGQITSIIWSITRKQLAITYGFLNCQPPMVIGVYQYPDMTLVAEAVPRTVVRALGIVESPDQSKIAVAVDDGTVRVFDLWDVRTLTVTNSPLKQAVGAFGSQLIESLEGIEVGFPSVR